MASGSVYLPGRGKSAVRGVPSLVDLCVETAIDNVRYIGNVGETDNHLLERILPHCTIEQLMHIENATEGRDLSPVTNKLWKKYYEKTFGLRAMNKAMENMKLSRTTFPWRLLYQAKSKDQEECQQESVERMTERYRQMDAKRQSRQIQICTKVPPGTRKRFYGDFGSGGSIGSSRSSIMKKAKVEFLNCREMKNRVAMKKISTQKAYSVPSPSKKPALPHKEPLTLQHKAPAASQRSVAPTNSRVVGKSPQVNRHHMR